MKFRFSIPFVMFLLALALIMPTVVMAQDMTVEPTPVETPVPEQPPVEEPDAPGFNLFTFLGGVAVGTLTALGAVFGLIGRLKNDLAAMNAIEWAGKNIPVEGLVEVINAMGRNMRDAGEVIDKVTDGLPNTVTS